MTHSFPFTHLYPKGVPVDLDVAEASLTAAWEDRVRLWPDEQALSFFDQRWSVFEVDQLSQALAAALRDRGIGRGDRVGVHLQNVPQYPVILLALWRLGAIAVLLNPMYHGRELQHLLNDSAAAGVFVDISARDVVTDAAEGTEVRWTIDVDPRSWQRRDDPRVFTDVQQVRAESEFDRLLRAHRGATAAAVELTWDDIALLTYTSGTTGPPKGAMNTHGNLLHVARGFERWLGLGRDVVLALAPMFHITGAVVNATLALIGRSELVVAHRFQAEVVRDAIREHGVTFTIGSITAYNALLAVSSPEDLRSLRLAYSGGAPIPAAVVERAREQFGLAIHNGYGMTETGSAVIAVPPGAMTPVNPASGSLSVGVPLPNVEVSIVDPAGVPLGPGQVGELVVSGPHVAPGYWRNAEATGTTMPGGRLRTGDGAIIDGDGWIYLVDRLKDQINVSGYKVWPREVEDTLCEHAAVYEAAVVGMPDEYSGERVTAFVVLRDGEAADEATLREFVRERLAAYKVPRQIHLLDELPKTETGKVRRSALR